MNRSGEWWLWQNFDGMDPELEALADEAFAWGRAQTDAAFKRADEKCEALKAYLPKALHRYLCTTNQGRVILQAPEMAPMVVDLIPLLPTIIDWRLPAPVSDAQNEKMVLRFQVAKLINSQHQPARFDLVHAKYFSDLLPALDYALKVFRDKKTADEELKTNDRPANPQSSNIRTKRYFPLTIGGVEVGMVSLDLEALDKIWQEASHE